MTEKKDKFILAPIRGVTNYIFRNVFRKYFFGFDFAVSPFIPTTKGKEVKFKLLKDVLPANNLMPIEPQIIGKDPEDIILTANSIYDLGYKTVNWNLGCPHKQVAKRKRGSGMLPHPEMIHEILSLVIPKLRGEFSIKLRLGRKDKNEIFSVLEVLKKFPIKHITIHPRTGEQMYQGSADVDFFEKCIPFINTDLIYNGDIFSKEDFYALKQRFPKINNWMIGRGVLFNPFLIDEISNNVAYTESLKKEKLEKFHSEIFEINESILFGENHLLGRMKEFWFYFSKNFIDGKKFLKRIQKAKSKNEYENIVTELFEL